jgi:DNA (cytosine-5)-methyltransferase 1
MRKEDFMEQLQILELFGGIGSPRIALRNLGVPVKSIDYVEIDPKCVASYNAMFESELAHLPQSVVGWNLRPDILIHGSPCQSISVAGHQGKATKEDGRINRGAGADEGSGTPSSLMWETIRIIRQLGEWKPKVIVWENVKNVRSRYMIHNFEKYLRQMEEMGYRNSYAVLDARDFGVPQARERTFTVSVLDDVEFDFSQMKTRPMKPLCLYLQDDYGEQHIVRQPTVYNAIGKTGVIRRATVIHDCAMTITTRQDRTPAQVIDLGEGKYRYLTEKECWRLQGYSDADFYAAESTCPTKPGKMNRTLYHQAGNSIPVPIFESMFEAMFERDILPRVFLDKDACAV